MIGVLIGFLVLMWLVSKYDKWDVRKEPKGNISLEEIQKMFEDNNKRS